MKIKDIFPYVVDADTSIKTSLTKINNNDYKIIFVVNKNGQLIGSLSDGDIRRWIIDGDGYTDDTPVLVVCNKNVKFFKHTKKTNIMPSDFSHGKTLIPVVDDKTRILYFEVKGGNGFYIKNVEISEVAAPFLIAEIGNNHQGDIAIAKKLILEAHNSGVQCVKFQMRSMDSLYGKNTPETNAAEDLGSQYTLDLLRRFQLTDDELYEAFEYSSDLGLIPMCTPWDLESLEKLESYGLPAYKVASADFTNFELLAKIAQTNKPMICSTGMSSEEEIHLTVEYLEKINAEYILLHCNSTYPTPFKDVQLRYLDKLARISNRVVGYSGHERGTHVPIAAVALGAKVIEKHITLDKTQEGADHKVSLLPHEFKSMCQKIREVYTAMGTRNYERGLTQGEILNRQVLSKSIFVTRRINKNDIIKRSDLTIKGPGKGLQPNRLAEVIGIKSNRNIPSNTELFETDLTRQIVKRGSYKILRPVGIPVRYHDYSRLTSNIDLDFIEFHFSYSDLNLNPEDFLKRDEKLIFAVHCPELFENDHILDLTSPNKQYRDKSISHLKRTIKTTLELKRYFPSTTKPTLVVNAGGWDKLGFLTPEEKSERYKILSDTLNSVDLSDINCAIQTMPPFPWHFGGQSHHNLFVDPQEAAEFCRTNDNVTLCLDTSHSMMACNHYGWNLKKFIETVSKHVTYIHLADAKGSDGEGVKFGQGDIDFRDTWRLLALLSPMTPFIPEVWQGHLNDGAGFWEALEYIESLEIN